MVIKCDMLINASTNKSGSTQAQVRTGGWSEGWYVEVDPDNARINFEDVCAARAALLPNNCTIVGQRYRIIGGGSSSGGKSFPGGSGLQGDIPQMALLCTVAGNGVPNIRRFRIGGIPDARVVEGEYNPSSAYTAALNRYFAKCQEDGMKFKYRNLAAGRVDIKSIDSTGLMTVFVAQTFNAIPFIDLLKCRDSQNKAVKGRFGLVAGGDNLHAQLIGWKGQTVVKGSFRLVQDAYSFVNQKSFNVGRVVVHKVGRAFFQYRGRASKRS